MSYRPTYQISVPTPGSSVARSAGGWKAGDTDVVNRWVQLESNGDVRLLADDGTPYGVILNVTGDQTAIALGPILRGKRAGNAALTRGRPVRGGTRQESATGSAERGFVQDGQVDTIVNLIKGRGFVTDGGATSQANTEGTLVEVLMWN